MKYSAANYRLDKIEADACILPIYKHGGLTPSGSLLNQEMASLIQKRYKTKTITGEIGQIQHITVLPDTYPFSQLLLVGAGDGEELESDQFLTICQNVADYLNKNNIAHRLLQALSEIPVTKRNVNWRIKQFILALEHAYYQFTPCQSEKKPPAAPIELQEMIFHVPKKIMVGPAELAIQDATAIGKGIKRTKDLANLPANICTPRYLAKIAKEIAKQHKKISAKILTETDIKKLRMGAFLSVTAGSREPARLIILHYKGNRPSRKPIVLVGKGITFDSGGISLKPSAGMDEMKYDMCGAASIMGTLQAAADIGLPLNIVGILPCCENLPGGHATKPGDIVTTLSGQTVEILNTDAEGRLILCDALSYAEKFKPELVIDVATLTGAMVISLGEHATGMMSNDDHLADDLLRAGEDSYDRAWRLPLWPAYDKALESNFADLANVGNPAGGSIIAARFLSRFTQQYRWAHLDIAGVAWQSGAAKGATGRPVALLVQYLLNVCNK